ncbi:MAG: DUF2778 domain-containing protein [Phycisphaeraceae bacterium]|nr:DUF2778 domain-containing protein [Phycisphaeraceae bacterium]
MLWATPQPAAAPWPARRGDRYPHITNVQFSTESLISDVCKLVERIRYEAYGRARHSWPEDLDEDGTFWFIDRNIALDHIAGSSIGDNGSWPAKRYNVLMDFDFSGTIEQDEYDAIQNNPDRAALPAGRMSDADFASGPWNPIGYDGYVYDDAADMSAVRFRWYDAKLGRWVSRDPAGYVDGMNLYQYVVANPLKYVDRNGWQAGQPNPSPTPGQPLPGAGGSSLPQCVDKSGKPIELTFDGDKLSGGGDGAQCSCPAASGKPIDKDTTRDRVDAYTDRVTTKYTFDNSAQRQRQRGAGTIPSGDYWIDTCSENSAANAWRHRWYSRGPYSWFHNGGQAQWGHYSWPITPFPNTNVDDENGNPRSGFMIHGGDEWGSAGCIDLTDGDATFHDFMDSVRSANAACCYIKVSVSYPRRFTTKTTTTLTPSPSPP